MPHESRALVVGESLIDIVTDASGHVVEHPGGSPMNVGIGLARLGFPVSFLTSVGDDARGDAIVSHAREGGVEVDPLSFSALPTSTATATLDASGAARYDFDLAWDVVVPETVDDSVVLLHVGSLGTSVEPGATRVHELARRYRNHAIVSFDPNIRPSLAGSPEQARRVVESVVAISDIVKASDEDIAWLYPGLTAREVAAGWLEAGAALVAVTSGGNGAFALTADAAAQRGSYAVTVADTIGAGDSFMSGLIAGLWDRDLIHAGGPGDIAAMTSEDLDAVLDVAVRCAAITVSRPGAQPPSRAELESFDLVPRSALQSAP